MGIEFRVKSLEGVAVSGDEDYGRRILDGHVSLDDCRKIKDDDKPDSFNQHFSNSDYLTADSSVELREALHMAKALLKYRCFEEPEGRDNRDSMPHSLRCLKNANLEAARLIVCSMGGEMNYPDLDKMLCDPEFSSLNKKVVITAGPPHLAYSAATHQVRSYQRRFMNAAKGQS